jgi:inosine-uridine nucleoside N-ribohydrolase
MGAQAAPFRVDVETHSALSSGQTVVDKWRTSGLPPNVVVATRCDAGAVWAMIVGAVGAADRVSPLNAAGGGGVS